MAAPLRLLGALAVGVLAATPLVAQRHSPSTYAITNARLIPVSGPAIERGTLVVRNGLIAAIGANVTVPADSRAYAKTLAAFPANSTLPPPEVRWGPRGAGPPGRGPHPRPDARGQRRRPGGETSSRHGPTHATCSLMAGQWG